jgi:hypothetical protein
MSRFTSATFVIGSEATLRVEHQLALSGQYLAARSGRISKGQIESIAARFDRLLSASTAGFDTEIPITEGQPLRVICSVRERTAALFYVVRSNRLQTVNLVVSGVDANADVSAIEELGQKLSPIDAYYESLAIVRFGARPMLATFCSRGGGLDRNIDCVQLAFAAVFFQRCGVSQPLVLERRGGSAVDQVFARRHSTVQCGA